MKTAIFLMCLIGLSLAVPSPPDLVHGEAVSSSAENIKPGDGSLNHILQILLSLLQSSAPTPAPTPAPAATPAP
ncbi:hypothetical protein MATL_G00222380 [Megalops atlanticus]|uniref:Uncharacterized protein n=1 Tax=Megalops atlanticus TaxID=7932 RepID=A0A9D3PEM7_MEGAT|nr:hypothetical protein MATL_G00222380 [Megalops atlanticus]